MNTTVKQYKQGLLDHEWLLENIKYNPLTGKFRWLKAKTGRNMNKDAGRNSGEYRELGFNQVTYKAHRVAWFYVHGVWPEGVIDHIDGDPSNNRLDNLQDVPQSTNVRKCRIRSDNVSGHKGIHWAKHANKWRAMTYINGNPKHIGYFTSILEAIQARQSA